MRTYFLVGIDLDPVPGAFHEPADAANRVEGILRSTIPHYRPTVSTDTELADAMLSDDGYEAIVAYVNDGMPWSKAGVKLAAAILKHLGRKVDA